MDLEYTLHLSFIIHKIEIILVGFGKIKLNIQMIVTADLFILRSGLIFINTLRLQILGPIKNSHLLYNMHEHPNFEQV